MCKGEDSFVVGARSGFRDRGNVVASRSESFDDGEVAALVGEEQHSLVSTVVRVVRADQDNFLVSDRVGRVAIRIHPEPA